MAAPHRPRDPGDGEFDIRENRELGNVLDGKYRLTGLIARGGMSRVFRATHVGRER